MKKFKIAKRKALFLETVLKRRNIPFEIKTPKETDVNYVIFQTSCSNSQFKFAVIRATSEMYDAEYGLGHKHFAECELKCKDKIFAELKVPEDDRDVYYIIPGKKGN